MFLLLPSHCRLVWNIHFMQFPQLFLTYAFLACLCKRINSLHILDLYFVCSVQQYVLFFSDNNVLFLLLNGEAYDYIGSSRVVWDMKNRVFPMKPCSSATQEPPPLNLHNIKLFVELGQISTLGGERGNKTTLYFHQHPRTSNIVLNRYEVS